jgi:hypothetical protein
VRPAAADHGRRAAAAERDRVVADRGVEIASDVADDVNRSVIAEQVEMGVAVRMACLDVLTRSRRGKA